MTAINTDIKNTANKALNKLVIERRANANIASATAWVGLAGLFASVPMSIRQRDWKIWALPFASACCVILAGYDTNREEFPGGYKIVGWATQAGLAGWFMKQNKDEAKFKLVSDEKTE